MYSTTTADFSTFSPTRLFYDPGFNVIDATILPAQGKYFLVIKDETVKPARKHLRLAGSPNPSGPWESPGAAFTRDWVEGPTCLDLGGEYIVYYDCYRDHKYGAVLSKDLVTWTDVSSRLSMPKGLRHGTAIPIDPVLLGALIQHPN
jgi:hypothetical protein